MNQNQRNWIIINCMMLLLIILCLLDYTVAALAAFICFNITSGYNIWIKKEG